MPVLLPVVSTLAWTSPAPPVSSNARGRSVKQRSRSCLFTSVGGHAEGNPPAYNGGKVTELNGIDRIFCLSDLHTDNPDNQKWLKARVSESDFDSKTLIIVAGDISHDMETFGKSLSVLAEKTNVLFVPGNHEAWIDRRHKPNSTSFDKLEEVYKLCHDLGVYTTSLLVKNDEQNCPHPLWIAPLESWYDGTLSFREELCHDFDHWPWVDFQRCVWKDPDFPPGPPGTPDGRQPMGLVDYFLKQNEIMLANNPFPNMFSPNGPDPVSTGIMTVSHFLPNLQSLPDWKDLDNPDFQDEWFDHGAGGMSAKFAKVAGSAKLDEQIRTLLPSSAAPSEDDKRRLIHIFGHSHRPKDFEWKGVRYIHNPLGKPRERALYMVSPTVDFQLVWDTSTGEVPGKQVLRFWEEQGGGVEALKHRLEKVKPRGRYNKHKGSAFKTSQNVTATKETPGI